MSVRKAILGLLAEGPRHGYVLRAEFEALVGGQAVWDVKPAQVYTTLSRLERGGLVRREPLEAGRGPRAGRAGRAAAAVPAAPERRVYAITDAGRAELAAWFAEGVRGERGRDEFFVKLTLCLGEPGRAAAVIRAQRASLYQELHELTARRGAADPGTSLARIILLDKTLMHVEADLRWLDMVEARLDDMGRQKPSLPPPRPRGRPRKAPR